MGTSEECVELQSQPGGSPGASMVYKNRPSGSARKIEEMLEDNDRGTKREASKKELGGRGFSSAAQAPVLQVCNRVFNPRYPPKKELVSTK